ncbi:MAG: hypothetical protein ACRD0P_29615 [Stackebrandtia sp.]
MNTPATAIAPRTWTLWAAVVLAAGAAVLHTFVQTGPTIGALMDGNTPAEARQSLRMMWHGMSAIAWTYPVVLLLMRGAAAEVARPVLGLITLLAGSEALLQAVAGLRADSEAGLLLLPQWTLYAAVAALAWLARPHGTAQGPTQPVRRGRGRLVLLWFTMILGFVAAVYHAVWGTLDQWAAALLVSDTPVGPKLTLYAMWLFSCVVFIAVPVTLTWSLRAPTAAGRFAVRYVAVLIAALMVSWTVTLVLGFGPDMKPVGPPFLGLLVALTAACAPPRVRSETPLNRR